MPDTTATTWRRAGAFDGLAVPGRHGEASGPPGLRIAPREPASLLSLLAAPGDEAAAAALIERETGLLAPVAPAATLAQGRALLWSGPGHWLLVSEETIDAATLAAALRPAVAVVDQGHSRALLRVSGPKARATLAKGCMIDLHPRRFAPGSAASTQIGHIGVQLWQVDDAPTYDLAVYRSLAGSFWTWLTASAAEFGYEVG